MTLLHDAILTAWLSFEWPCRARWWLLVPFLVVVTILSWSLTVPVAPKNLVPRLENMVESCLLCLLFGERAVDYYLLDPMLCTKTRTLLLLAAVLGA